MCSLTLFLPEFPTKFILLRLSCEVFRIRSVLWFLILQQNRWNFGVLRRAPFALQLALLMIGPINTDWDWAWRICVCAFAFVLTACVTAPPTAPDSVQALPRTITVPYRISDAGHLLVNLSVNGQDNQAFIIDSGATISAIYEEPLRRLGLDLSGKFVSVKGLIATGDSPTIADVKLSLGSRVFQSDDIVMLKTQDTPHRTIGNGAVGLLGTDFLAAHTVVFDRHAMRASFLPSDDVTPEFFAGWRKIPLENRVGNYPDHGLYFAHVKLLGKQTPVLVDTGSNLNFINWHLATLDDQLKRVRRKIRKAVEFRGANGATPLHLETFFYDVTLGNHTWPQVKVNVLEFESFDEIAPTDKPMMLAGAPMFSPSSFAFDFGGNVLYIYEP